MTIENWLMIAVIISTLIAPTLANLIQFLRNQPKPTPDANQPKNLIQRIGGWLMRLISSPWGLPPFVIVLNIYFLSKDLRDPAPLTRRSVFLISLEVAAILFGGINMSILFIWQAIRRLSDISRGLLDLINTVNNTVGVISSTLNTLALIKRAEAKPGTMRKMLTVIKNLFNKAN